MPPKKKSTSKGSLKNSVSANALAWSSLTKCPKTSQQRTLFDHFQKKGKPDADAEANGSVQGSQELKPEAPPSSPPQIVEPEPVDASAEVATSAFCPYPVLSGLTRDH